MCPDVFKAKLANGGSSHAEIAEIQFRINDAGAKVREEMMQVVELPAHNWGKATIA
jgi:hypothetical protein